MASEKYSELFDDDMDAVLDTVLSEVMLRQPLLNDNVDNAPVIEVISNEHDEDEVAVMREFELVTIDDREEASIGLTQTTHMDSNILTEIVASIADLWDKYPPEFFVENLANDMEYDDSDMSPENNLLQGDSNITDQLPSKYCCPAMNIYKRMRTCTNFCVCHLNKIPVGCRCLFQ